MLGYEANFAGTSFLTLDKWESKKFNYGSKIVNIQADKTQVGSLGAVGYDDEGVQCGQWDIVKEGTLVNYQTIRDQAHMLGLNASQGCCYADNWSSVQFQRMPNISLQPGKEKKSIDDMIKGVEKGIYIIGDGSFSIDQQRYNFQFGGQLTTKLKTEKLLGCYAMLLIRPTHKSFGIHAQALPTKVIIGWVVLSLMERVSLPRAVPSHTDLLPHVSME